MTDVSLNIGHSELVSESNKTRNNALVLRWKDSELATLFRMTDSEQPRKFHYTRIDRRRIVIARKSLIFEAI